MLLSRRSSVQAGASNLSEPAPIRLLFAPVLQYRAQGALGLQMLLIQVRQHHAGGEEKDGHDGQSCGDDDPVSFNFGAGQIASSGRPDGYQRPDQRHPCGHDKEISRPGGPEYPQQ